MKQQSYGMLFHFDQYQMKIKYMVDLPDSEIRLYEHAGIKTGWRQNFICLLLL